MSTGIYSQPRLVLSRLGNQNRLEFYEGQEIYLQTKDTDYYVGGLIIGINDSTVRFANFDIRLDEIAVVDIDGMSMGGFNTGQYGPMIMIGGIVYMGADLINQGNITGETATVGFSTMAFGYLLWKTRRKKFKVYKPRNKLLYINY